MQIATQDFEPDDPTLEDILATLEIYAQYDQKAAQFLAKKKK